MFAQLFSIVAPVFVSAGIGFVWARSGRTYDTEMVTTLMVTIATPCLVFSTLIHAELSAEALGAMALIAIAAFVTFAAVGSAVLKLAGLPIPAYLPSLVFPNTGNMGLPLCLLAFGDEGLALAIAYFTVSAVGQFVFGPAIAEGRLSFRALARNPIIYAVAIAIVFLAFRITPPEWLSNTTRLIGGMTIPMMLITLGVSLASLKVGGMGRSVAVSLVRLVMGFAVGVALAEILDLEGAMRGVVILESAMPAAVFNYLFAQRYKTRPEEVAGAVVVSTAISFATLPALIWFVL